MSADRSDRRSKLRFSRTRDTLEKTENRGKRKGEKEDIESYFPRSRVKNGKKKDSDSARLYLGGALELIRNKHLFVAVLANIDPAMLYDEKILLIKKGVTKRVTMSPR